MADLIERHAAEDLADAAHLKADSARMLAGGESDVELMAAVVARCRARLKETRTNLGRFDFELLDERTWLPSRARRVKPQASRRLDEEIPA